MFVKIEDSIIVVQKRIAKLIKIDLSIPHSPNYYPYGHLIL